MLPITIGVTPTHLKNPIPSKYNTIGTISTAVSISSEDIKLLAFNDMKNISKTDNIKPRYRRTDIKTR